MENRSHAIVAVIFLLLLAAAAIGSYYWLADRRNEPRIYQIVTDQSVSGLARQSEVRFKGLPVGHVTAIGFDPSDPARVIVRLALVPDAYVTHATYAVIAMQGLTGGSVLELKLGKGPRSALKTRPDAPARIPLHPSLLDTLTHSARQDLKGLHTILGDVQQVLGASNRQHLSATLAQLDTASQRLATIEATLRPTLKRLPALIANLDQGLRQSHQLLAHTDQLLQAAQPAVRQLPALEQSLQQLLQTSRQLSRRLDRQTAPDVQALSQSLLRTSRQLQQLLRQLQAKPQSLLFGPPAPPPGPGEPGFPPTKHPGHD